MISSATHRSGRPARIAARTMWVTPASIIYHGRGQAERRLPGPLSDDAAAKFRETLRATAFAERLSAG